MTGMGSSRFTNASAVNSSILNVLLSIGRRNVLALGEVVRANVVQSGFRI